MIALGRSSHRSAGVSFGTRCRIGSLATIAAALLFVASCSSAVGAENPAVPSAATESPVVETPAAETPAADPKPADPIPAERNPAEPQPAEAAPAAAAVPAEAPAEAPSSTSPTARSKLTLDFVTDDATAVLALRPQGFFGRNEFKILDELLNQQGDFRIPVPVTQIEQLTMVMTRPNVDRPAPDPNGTNLIFDINIVRSLQPVDWAAKRKSQNFEMREAEHAGRQYFTIPDQPNMCFWPADERTFVVADRWTLKRVIEQAPGDSSKLPWNDTWDQLADGPLIIAFDSAWAVTAIKGQAQNQSNLRMVSGMLEGLLKDTKAMLCGLDASEGVRGRLLLSCGDEAQAKKKLQGFKGLVSLARQMSKPKPTPKPPGDTPASEPTDARSPGATPSQAEMAEKLLSSAKFTQSGTTAIVTIQADIEVASAMQLLTGSVGGLLGANVASAAVRFQSTPQVEAPTRPVPPGVLNSPTMVKRRELSRQQLSEVAAAIHKYHERQQALPPREVTSADGAPLLSWRVLILPDLGYEELFKQFHLDEPWDSEHNLPLAQKMPRQFAGPLEADAEPTSNNTAVVALVGAQTCFADGPAHRWAEITDGMANTLLLAETRGSSPWTKPEDVAVDSAGKPARRLGGIHPGGVVLATADGQSHFVVDQIITELLPALLTIAGGETVDEAKLNQK